MAERLVIGNKAIPVLGHFELSGTAPIQNPSVSIEQDAQYLYINGIQVGERNRGDAAASTSFVGGRTSIHDSTEIVAGTPTSTTSWFSTIDIIHQNGETAESLLTTQGLQVSPANQSEPQTNSAEKLALYALEYSYPDAIVPNERVAGYYIRGVFCGILYDNMGQIRQISYHIATGINVNIPIPYLNRSKGVDCYYEDTTPVEPFDPSEPEPYEPTIDNTSDLITTPATPVIGVTNSGFINVYNPAMNGLTGLGTVLFPDVNISTDVLTSLQSICEVIMNANLINYVIDCHVIPCAPAIGSSAEITVGFRSTGIYAPVVTSDYVRITCGSLSIQEYFSSFADYIASSAKLFLPFVGFVDMIPEYWQSGTIGVEYMFNIIDGSFMAYVTSVSSKSSLNGSVIASYSGNACMHFPVTGVNYANMVSGIVGAAASIVTKGTWSAAMGGAASIINSFSKGGDVQQSNGYNSTSAFLSVRTPYMIIERAVPSYPAGYGHSKGYPSNIATMLSNVSGYTVIEDIDLSGIPFTSGELDELKQLLADGVYF